MKHVSRPGLYIMVFFCLLNSCEADYNATEAHKHIHEVMDHLGLDHD